MRLKIESRIENQVFRVLNQAEQEGIEIEIQTEVQYKSYRVLLKRE